MKINHIKRWALTLGIAFVVAIVFFFVQHVIRDASLHISLIGAGVLFALTGSSPIWFFLGDRLTEKRNGKDMTQNP